MHRADRVLGLEFFHGSTRDAVRAGMTGGLVVAPSATCFTRLQHDAVYRRAMTAADVVLADSGLMVLLWRATHRERLTRISGLAYLKELIAQLKATPVASVLWVLPHERSRAKAEVFLANEGVPIGAADCYIAPMYPRDAGAELADPELLRTAAASRPAHIVIAIAGGVQEKLGYYLKQHLDYPAAIHCIGGALGFLTGDQVAIPAWADRLYLGWLLRLLANPRQFAPRALAAFALPGLIARYGREMPALCNPADDVSSPVT